MFSRENKPIMPHSYLCNQRLLITWTFTLFVLVSACQDALPSKDVAYRVIFRESEAGEYTKQQTADRQFEYYFTYTDRGRGPKFQESITLDDEGFIKSHSIQGLNYLKDRIDEHFSVSGETALINNPSGKKKASFSGRQLYFRFDGSPAAYEILANLLLAQENNTIALYPEGEAKLIQTIPKKIAGLDLQVLLINGLDYNPVYLWMDDHEMIARLEGNLHVVRNDLLEARLDMKAIQDSLENEYLFELSSTLSHEYSQTLIKNVSIFTAEGKVLPNRDVLVKGPTIASIVPSESTPPNPNVLLIDGSGKMLMPGLFDMHTHNNKFRGLLHIAGGVTSVRDMANNKQLVGLQAQFDEHRIIGPRIIYKCGIIDGSGPYANQRNVVNNLREGLREVQSYQELGYQQIKLYSSIRPEWVKSLADKSHELGMKVSGHIPAFMTAAQAIEQGYDEIQHINMLFLNFLSDTIDTRTPLRFTMVAKHGGNLDLESKEYLDFIAILQRKGIIIDPTVSVFEHMFIARKGVPSPTYEKIMNRLPLIPQRSYLSGGLPKSKEEIPIYQAAFDKMLAMIHDLYLRDITIVPGTDGLPGFLYHRELELYHQSGIPTTEIFKMATLLSARIAGVEQRLGSIQTGKQADLILVNGNPLADISDIRKIDCVLKGGRLFYPKEIYASIGVDDYR